MPSPVNLLLVDDNPMVLEMLRQAFSAFASVQTRTDAADALLDAIDNPPDIIVSDFDMPGMNGRQLLDKVRNRAATAHTPFLMMASKADINEKLKPLQDKVEEFLEKPFFVKEVARRVKRVVDKVSLEKMAREAPSDSMVRGNLAQMNTLDLFQSLDLGHKTCALVLTSEAGERCQVFFTDGQINHAVCGGLKGDEAVYRVLAWEGGTFEIDFTGSSAEQTTTRSTQGLLMEGLRLLDESNRDASDDNVLEE